MFFKKKSIKRQLVCLGLIVIFPVFCQMYNIITADKYTHYKDFYCDKREKIFIPGEKFLFFPIKKKIILKDLKSKSKKKIYVLVPGHFLKFKNLKIVYKVAKKDRKIIDIHIKTNLLGND